MKGVKTQPLTLRGRNAKPTLFIRADYDARRCDGVALFSRAIYDPFYTKVRLRIRLRLCIGRDADGVLSLPSPLQLGEVVLKSELLRAIRQEIYEHDFSHFVDEPPSTAHGEKGVVDSGCRPAKSKSAQCRNS